MKYQQKQDFVADMKSQINDAAGVLFVDFTGLTVAEADGFRQKIREANASYQVVKNTLMTRVLDGTDFADAAKCLKGTPTGVVIGQEDPVSPAKATYEYLEECQHLKVKGGVLDKKAISPEQAEALSKMPSREEMIVEVAALALAPARNLLAQIKSPAGKLVGAIEAKANADEG